MRTNKKRCYGVEKEPQKLRYENPQTYIWGSFKRIVS